MLKKKKIGIKGHLLRKIATKSWRKRISEAGVGVSCLKSFGKRLQDQEMKDKRRLRVCYEEENLKALENNV